MSPFEYVVTTRETDKHPETILLGPTLVMADTDRDTRCLAYAAALAEDPKATLDKIEIYVRAF